MRLAPLISLLALVACASNALAPTPAVARAQATAPAAPPQRWPLELALGDGTGAEHVVTWTEQLELPPSLEDAGAFGYAQRKTSLRSGDVVVGWLEPGARVGVVAATRDRVEVSLFAWTDRSGDGRLHASVDARDLGPRPPRDVPPFGRAIHPERTIARGQWLFRVDGEAAAFTFCGPVEVLDDGQATLHVLQREDGVVFEGRVDRDATWQDHACPGLIVAHGNPDQIVYHDRRRAFRDQALPPSLVEAGPYRGVTFAELARKRATVYWLVDDRDRGATCQAWQLAPAKPGADGGELVARSKLDDGSTAVTRFGAMFGPAADTRVTLLGPSWKTIAPSGAAAGSGSLGCGSELQIVAREPDAFVMLRDPPGLLGSIRGYDPRDTERWYTDRGRCERDADATRQRVASSVAVHRGC